MKVSQYLCDFNENLKSHGAHLHMLVDEADAVKKKDFDVCSKHVLSMIASSFLNREGAKTLTLTKINGSSTKVETKADQSHAGVTYEKKPCPAGCGREFAPQGRRAHLAKFHPDYKPEGEEAAGFLS
jgi:hypothetical protein